MSEIVGCDAAGKLTSGGIAVEKKHRQHRWNKESNETSHHTAHEELVAIGWRWGKHISEAWRVMFICGAYILVTITFGVSIFHLLLALVLSFTTDDPSSECWEGVKFPFADLDQCDYLELAVGTVVSAADALFYVMCPILIYRAIRLMEGRPLYHRFGKRCIIVADNPWIGRCTEAFVVKLYSLAYSFCTPEVHSGDPVDSMIHDHAARSVRGLLVAVGRPDGRLFSFTKTEAAVILATKQMSFVENMGSMPEVMSLGSNPHFDHNVYAHVALPSASRPKFVDEFLYSQVLERQKVASEDELSPRNFLKGLQSSLRRSKAKGGGVADNTAIGVLGLDALMDMSNSMSASSGGLQEMIKKVQMVNSHSSGRLDGSHGSGHSPRLSPRLDPQHTHHELLPLGTSMEGLGSSDINVFQSNLDARTGRFLGRFSLSQRLLEARFNSLERFVSFCVIFHASAESTNRGLWGLSKWDMSRSQSHMRINTTACPVMDTLTDMEDASDGGGSVAVAGKLKEVKVFRDMPGTMLELVAAKCTIAQYGAGAKVVHQGDVGDTLFMVESGQAVLVLDKKDSLPTEVGQCGAGDHFCESALTRDDYRQPASVVTITPLTVLRLSKTDLLIALGAVTPNAALMNHSMDDSSTGRTSSGDVVNPLNRGNSLDTVMSDEPEGLLEEVNEEEDF